MVKIFADGASLDQMEKLAADPLIKGFTTNPSLMKKAGITNYRDFAKSVLALADGKPVSFEVLADDFPTMKRQANEIASWGKNVWVKIPITNTAGRTSIHLIDSLKNININCTAVMTREQSFNALDFLKENDILSVFAGRVADTGVPPLHALAPALGYTKMGGGKAKILWASAREILNYYQACEWGVDIITLTSDLLAKLSLEGKDLDEYSLETVKQFHNDGKGITL
jgi:transaldolase